MKHNDWYLRVPKFIYLNFIEFCFSVFYLFNKEKTS